MPFFSIEAVRSACDSQFDQRNPSSTKAERNAVGPPMAAASWTGSSSSRSRSARLGGRPCRSDETVFRFVRWLRVDEPEAGRPGSGSRAGATPTSAWHLACPQDSHQRAGEQEAATRCHAITYVSCQGLTQRERVALQLRELREPASVKHLHVGVADHERRAPESD